MSTKLRILFFLCGIISSNLFSQAGTSCATAIPIPNPPGNLPTQVQVNNEQWFVFHDTISGSGDVTIANSGDTTNYINHVNVYKGSCSNLQLLTSATITSYSSDLSMDIAVNSDPTDLYIQTFRTPPVNNSLVKLGIYVDVQFQNNPFMASVCSNGKVQAWGDNSMGQLGRNTGFSTFSATPTNILPFGNDLSPAVAVSMGGNHAVAMLSDGTVW